jgi:hypothetical protein
MGPRGSLFCHKVINPARSVAGAESDLRRAVAQLMEMEAKGQWGIF